jgi:uncharacterized protein YcfL
MRNIMKKWLLVVFTVLLLSGCSLNKLWKWFDEMEWEREDETIRVVDLIIR